MTKDTPIVIAPKKTYCLLLPHFDFVLSEMNPMMGSVRESNIRGARETTPTSNQEILNPEQAPQ